MTDRPPRVETPFRLDLDQQKKRAKELLRTLRAGDAGLRLCDAQHILARRLGLPSWPRLKAHIQAMEQARAAMATGPAPDGDVQTLHIRCGSDIRQPLRAAGFTGDFLEYADPLCQGPVTGGPDFLAVRARFLADAYGGEMGFSFDQALERQRREEEGLRAAARFRRVVLWFEHDSYDQLILARCLARFVTAGALPVLEMVCIDRFPGSARFIGLGQLPPEALRLLWAGRRPVTVEQGAAGLAVWHALQADDPSGLAALMAGGTGALPHMAGALHRHVQELPSVGDGLGLTQRLTLETLAEAGRSVEQVWRVLMRERDPRPWLGDVMYWAIIRAMLAAADPMVAVEADSAGEPWPRRRLTLTAAGRAVLAGERDGLACGPPDRWVGGVPVRAGRPGWRWDEAVRRPRWSEQAP